MVLISMKGKSPEESSDFIGEMSDMLRAIVSAVRETCIFKSKKLPAWLKKKTKKNRMSKLSIFS